MTRKGQETHKNIIFESIRELTSIKWTKYPKMDYPEGVMGYNLSHLPQHTAIPTEVASPEAGEQKSPKILMTSRGQVQTNVSSLELLGLPDTRRVQSLTYSLPQAFTPKALAKRLQWLSQGGTGVQLVTCCPAVQAPNPALLPHPPSDKTMTWNCWSRWAKASESEPYPDREQRSAAGTRGLGEKGRDREVPPISTQRNAAELGFQG